MPKSHACEEKHTKSTKELTFSNNSKLFKSSRIIVQQKMKHDAWHAIIDQPL